MISDGNAHLNAAMLLIKSMVTSLALMQAMSCIHQTLEMLDSQGQIEFPHQYSFLADPHQQIHWILT